MIVLVKSVPGFGMTYKNHIFRCLKCGFVFISQSDNSVCFTCGGEK